MKGAVVSALRWRDLPWAAWRLLRRGERCNDDFRAGFAASLGQPVEALWLFGAGRSALHALVAALDLPPDAEALLPGYTCVVVPNVFLHLGLPVRYVDIAAPGFNPTAEAVVQALRPNTAVVVLPHNFGLCMADIEGLRERFPQVVFIEDAAHAWGSRDAEGRLAGTRAQAAFFSFEYSKPLSTGLGGALLVTDPALRARMTSRLPALHRPTGRTVLQQGLTLAWHRLSMSLPRPLLAALQALLRAPSRLLGLVAKTPEGELSGAQAPDYAQGLHPWSAALGLAQLRGHEALWALRRQQAADYDALLSGLDGVRPAPREAQAVLLRYPLRLVVAGQRSAVLAGLHRLGIVGGVWFDDVVHPRGSLRWGYVAGDCPVGEATADAVINLPLGLHAQLSQQQRVGLRALLAALPGPEGRR